VQWWVERDAQSAIPEIASDRVRAIEVGVETVSTDALD
jgi:hypothetical protein